MQQIDILDEVIGTPAPAKRQLHARLTLDLDSLTAADDKIKDQVILDQL